MVSEIMITEDGIESNDALSLDIIKFLLVIAGALLWMSKIYMKQWSYFFFFFVEFFSWIDHCLYLHCSDQNNSWNFVTVQWFKALLISEVKVMCVQGIYNFGQVTKSKIKRKVYYIFLSKFFWQIKSRL